MLKNATLRLKLIKSFCNFVVKNFWKLSFKCFFSVFCTSDDSFFSDYLGASCGDSQNDWKKQSEHFVCSENWMQDFLIQLLGYFLFEFAIL